MYFYIKASLFILFVLFQQCLFSIDFKKIEKHVDNTPNSNTKSVSLLSKYLTGAFEREDEKFAAIYFWIAKNIKYDLNQRNLNRKYFKTIELVDEVMKRKKGVCQHYSELFHELSRLAGLKSQVVSGYGKEFKKVMNLAHSWNVISVNGRWLFVDATWGAGYLFEGKYKSDFQLKYFMVEPNQFILDHISFDPMWQLLSYPIKFEEFDSGIKSDKKKKKFNYNDSIKEYFKQTEIERKINTIRRIETNGIRNRVVKTELKHERAYVDVALKNEEIKNLNLGNNYFNLAVKQLNQFYKLKDKKNKGELTDSKLKLELYRINQNLSVAKKYYVKVKTNDKEIVGKLREVNAAVKKFEKILSQQKKYLKNL